MGDLAAVKAFADRDPWRGSATSPGAVIGGILSWHWPKNFGAGLRFLPSGYRDAMGVFVIIIAVLIFKPTGPVSRARRSAFGMKLANRIFLTVAWPFGLRWPLWAGVIPYLLKPR